MASRAAKRVTLRYLIFVTISAVSWALVPVVHSLADPSCDPTRIFACGQERQDHYEGVLHIPGAGEVNAEVARGGGCVGCEWTLVLGCPQNDLEDPDYANCMAARCPGGTKFMVYLLRPPAANFRYVETVCLTPRTPVLTLEDLHREAQRHLGQLRPPVTSIKAQPSARSVVNLPTYFIAEGPQRAEQPITATTPGGVPLTLTLLVAPDHYTWEFGDGAVCQTTGRGASYPGGTPSEECGERVAHAFRAAGQLTTTLTTTWAGSYTFDAGFGAVGPFAIPGTGVAGPPQSLAVLVREARAELVGG